MRVSALILIVLALIALAGCAATPDPNYTAYVRFVEQQQVAQQQRYASIAATADGCQDDACRTTIAAFAALAQAGSGNSAATLQPYRKQFHPAWNILGASVPALINGAVAWRQSENSRDVSIAQFDWLGGMMSDLANSPALQSPSVTVGGHYVTGSQHIGDDISGHIGDSIGRDVIGGDQHVGDSIGRDVIGGDRIDNRGNLGTDNRIDSPGPIDNSGDRCDGEHCQGDDNSPPPDPAPDDGDP